MRNGKRCGLLILGVGVGCLLAAGCGEAVTAPKEFKDFSSKDGVFTCKYPAGWEMEGGGGTRSEYSMTKFTKGGAEIRIESDLAGSLFADMSRAQNAEYGSPETPVARVHEMKKKATSDEFSNYKEREAKSFKSNSLGEGRKAIFVADGSFGSKVYGYRATLLTNDKRLTILCQCPATDWKALRPAFDKVIASIGR